MSAHDTAISIAQRYAGADLSEANTRHQVIDPILHDVLGWPRERVSTEEYIKPGFADYVLHRNSKPSTKDDLAASHPIVLIEAKRSGAYFALPHSLLTGRNSGYVQVKTLLTDQSISEAINQVRTYCLDIGCDFGAITNGHTWIFFRTFQKGEDWKNLRAFVIASLEYFASNFTDAHNNLAYDQIVGHGSLSRLLLGDRLLNRELFYPKEHITAFNVSIDVNNTCSSAITTRRSRTPAIASKTL